MHQLIITADDYGMSKAVNKAIDEGIEAGLITSTNVMTNMPYYQEARKLMDNPSVSVGMHWVLTCGKPVLPAEEVPSLVTAEGNFYDYPDFRKRYRKHLINDDEIKKELTAQYQLFIDHVGRPDYWNTHQNFLVDLHLYTKIVRIAKELGFAKMRSHQRIYVPGSDNTSTMSYKWRLVEPFKYIMLEYFQKKARGQGMNSSNGVIMCLNVNDVYKLDYIFSHIQWKNRKTGEYVIHPATDVDSPYFGELVDRRIWEYQTFSNPETKEMISKSGIKLIDYCML